MAIKDDIRGIIGTILQIGLGGPNIKNNSGTLEIKNAADSAYAPLSSSLINLYNSTFRGTISGAFTANRVIAVQDISGTLALLTDITASAGSKLTEIQFPTALVTVDSVATIPINAQVVMALIDVTTPYSPGATIAIGNSTTPNLLMTTAQNLATEAETYRVWINTDWGATPSLPVKATIAGSPGAGVGIVRVWYVEPLV